MQVECVPAFDEKSAPVGVGFEADHRQSVINAAEIFELTERRVVESATFCRIHRPCRRYVKFEDVELSVHKPLVTVLH